MAKYYATVAGLPNIGVEDRTLPFSSSFFVQELEKVLTRHDQRLLDLLRFEEENRFVIRFLEDESVARTASDKPSLFTYDDLATALSQLQAHQPVSKEVSLPSYIITFLKDTQVEPVASEDEDEASFLDDEEEEGYSSSSPKHLEDKLAEYYYAYATASGNAFIRDWSRFNQTLRNIFAAHVGRELGWDLSEYIVGNSPLEEKLKHSRQANFGIEEDELEEITKINQITAEKDITRRERMIDVLKWEWLEERTFDYVFDIEAILCYYLRLRILERWTLLNEKTGEATFRSIVAALKKESNESLQEFKNSQKR